MNIITHIIVGAAVGNYFGEEYKSVALIASVIPDIDHLGYYIHRLYKSQTPNQIWNNTWDSDGLLRARTLFHEPFGVALWLLIGLFIIVANSNIGEIFCVSIALHFFLDFISGSSKPFRPYNKKVYIDLRLPWKFRIIEEFLVIICSLLILFGN